MRRGLFVILAVLALVAMSGRDAHAKLFFGTQERINHLQDITFQSPKGESLYLGFVTATHSFMLPYSRSEGGYVLGVKGVSDKYYKLSKEMLGQMQLAGALPKTLPVYRASAIDYIWGYALWPFLLIVGIAGFFQSRKNESEQGQARAA